MNLRDDLHRVADDAPLEPIAMAGIRAKARSIRRRRTLAAVGGAATGVAAIVAATVLVLPSSGDHSDPLPSTRTPTPTDVSSTPSTPVTTVDFNPNDVSLTTGAEVSIPSWQQGVLDDAHGNTAQVSTPVHHALVDMHAGGWRGITTANGKNVWTHWNSKGVVVEQEDTPGVRGSVAVSPDDHRFAVMVDTNGSPAIWVYQPDVRSIPVPMASTAADSGAGVDVLLANGDVVFDADQGDVRIAHSDGSISQLPGGYRSVVAATPSGLLVALEDAKQAGSTCYAFVTATGTKQGETCTPDGGFYGLNADGRLVVQAFDDATTGAVYASIAPFPLGYDDSAGKQFKFPAGTQLLPEDGAWVGDTFVMPAWSDGEWTLILLSTDGYKVARSLHLAGSSDSSPLLLGARSLTTAE